MGTILTLPIAEIKHRDILFEDHFDNNIAGWEIIEDEDERSFIKDGHYFMENKSQCRWMYFHKSLPKGLPRNYVINTEIELLDHGVYGQFGLVWGFTKPHHILNRFVVSAESDRFTVSRFEKDHHRVFHRFSDNTGRSDLQRPDDLPTNVACDKFFLSVMLLDDYYYFFLQEYSRPVYICHRSHLPTEGDRFGFYVEPGVMIRAKSIKVQRIISNPNFNGSAWMPIGSEVVNGR